MHKKTIKFFHKLAYVNFKSKKEIEDSVVLSKQEFYDVLADVSSKYKQIIHTTTIRKYPNESFALTEKKHHLRLTYRDENGLFHQCYTNFKDDSKNKRDKTKVFAEFSQMFYNDTDLEIDEAFGMTPQFFKRCVPGLFHYDNPLYTNSMQTNVGKLDFSSHFPACACGELPDANTGITVQGYAKPTKEYPFAFYTKSGFVAEYNKYNSRDWYNTIYKQNLFESEERLYPVKPVPEDEEVTILMKPSQYRLDRQMHYYYNKKLRCRKGTKEYDNAKIVLLKIVGMFEMNDYNLYCSHPYAHLAAVIKARAIYKMLNLIDKIGRQNIISVIVDGLIFHNTARIHLGDKGESIGSLKEEAFQALGRFKGHNQYVLYENNKYDIAHAGYDINIDQPDMSKWAKSPAVHLKDVIRDELNLYIEDLNYDKKNYRETI